MSTGIENATTSGPGRLSQFFRAGIRQPDVVLAWLWLAFIGLAAVAPGLIAPGDPLAHDSKSLLLLPSIEHPFGTDDFGRDQFVRTVHGTVYSLQAAVVAVLIGLVLGSAIGLVSGALGRWVDVIVMRIIDAMLSVPGIIISLAIVAALGRGTINVAIAIGITSVANFARLMRSEVLRVRALPYVEASGFTGHGFLYTLARHIVPNASGSVLAVATIDIGTAILAVAALSFLGFGAPPPTPEWGALVSSGRNFMTIQWGLTALPGLFIIFTVLSVYRIARSLNRGRTALVG